jgi:hypothetical protein
MNPPDSNAINFPREEEDAAQCPLRCPRAGGGEPGRLALRLPPPARFVNGIIPKGRQHWVFARADRVGNLRDKTAMDSMVDFNDDISHCPCNKHQFSVVSCLLI